MLEIYKKIAFVFIGVLVLTLFGAYLCLSQLIVEHELLPKSKSDIPWFLHTDIDTVQGGTSSNKTLDARDSLEYQYLLAKSESFPFPYLIQMLTFADLEKGESLIDLSAYSSVSLKIKCSPRNELFLNIYSFDENVTRLDEMSTFRVATSPFSCHEGWSEISIDLNKMKTVDWWLLKFQQDRSDKLYRLDKVLAIGICSSYLGITNASAAVEVSGLSLHRYNWTSVWCFGIVGVIIWGAFIFWFIQTYASGLRAYAEKNVKNNHPYIAYQKLTIDSLKNKKRIQLIQFISSEYCNAETSLENTASVIGLTKKKVNEILKEELDVTFSVYLNTLRLNEAARQLAQQHDRSITEVAHNVGYNSISYFSKVFKEKYGYTPKRFRNISLTSEVE